MSLPGHTLYAIGKIEKAFGVKGDVVIQIMTSSPGRFKRLKQVYIGTRAEDVKLSAIKSVQVDGRGVRLRFVDTPDRTKAEDLKGNLIFVDESEVVRPERGSYFIHEIVGLRVIDEHNNDIGVVKDVLRFPAQDVYVIGAASREWMLPAVKEFITSIDVVKRVVRVRLIEGIMEL